MINHHSWVQAARQPAYWRAEVSQRMGACLPCPHHFRPKIPDRHAVPPIASRVFFCYLRATLTKCGNSMRVLILIVGLSLAGPALANCKEDYLEFLNAFGDLRFQRMLLETESDGPMTQEEKQDRVQVLLNKAQSTRGLIDKVQDACQDNPQFVDAVTKAEAYVDTYEEDLKAP
ncbi:MAG: hypothetical protein LC637_06060 [Xanthomonadaceae bacterium]|nr:hypothetical protein [Xanthomonadaceae bacterium]